MLSFLLKCLNLPFSICYLAFVTKYCLNFSDKLISILGIFFFHLVDFLLYIYIFMTHSLSQTSTVIILSLVAMTLLLLRNNQISFYQSSNFIQSPSNYPRSETMLLGITAYSVVLYTTSTSTVNISSISDVTGFIVLFPSKVYSSVILNDLSTSDNTSIPSVISTIIVSKVQQPKYYDIPVV